MIGFVGFDSRRGLGMFLFTTASRTALEPTKPPMQWVPGSFSLGVKRPGREADHSPPSSAECVELYLHSPNTPSWRGAYLSTGTPLPFTFYIYGYKHAYRFVFKITCWLFFIEVVPITHETVLPCAVSGSLQVTNIFCCNISHIQQVRYVLSYQYFTTHCYMK
jgi:hypothetical protein